jgi:hypothetical protein
MNIKEKLKTQSRIKFFLIVVVSNFFFSCSFLETNCFQVKYAISERIHIFLDKCDLNSGLQLGIKIGEDSYQTIENKCVEVHSRLGNIFLKTNPKDSFFVYYSITINPQSSNETIPRFLSEMISKETFKQAVNNCSGCKKIF